jgi:hypothetical protein
MLEYSWVAEQLEASQEGLSSMELVQSVYFNYVLSTALWGKIIVNNELVNMWKETVVTYLLLPYRHFPETLEKPPKISLRIMSLGVESETRGPSITQPRG